MKYIVMLCDGAADEPNEKLGGLTPLQAAHKPTIDALAARAEVGIAATTPEGMEIGSVTTNMGIMGYEPHDFYTGRSPLEAVSMGVELSDTDVAMRMNLVTLTDEADYADKSMADYSSQEISTPEAAQLVASLKETFASPAFDLHAGISYRHCLVWHGGSEPAGLTLTPPHDIAGQKVTEHLPKGEQAAPLLEMMKKSVEILKDHPVNAERVARGLRPATSAWFWGAGTKPAMEGFSHRFGKTGAIVSAVDLIKGLGLCAGMDIYPVEGATGNIDTNFEGKAEAAIRALREGHDLVYIHVEAPDECGHQGDPLAKKQAIEWIDSRLLSKVLAAMQADGEDVHVLVMPDHPTLVRTKGHSDLPVPYLLYRSEAERDSGVTCFCEEQAKAAGNFVAHGCELMPKLFA